MWGKEDWEGRSKGEGKGRMGRKVLSGTKIYQYTTANVSLCVKVKGKGQTLVIAPQVAHYNHRGAQVHGTHQAASHIPAFIPS